MLPALTSMTSTKLQNISKVRSKALKISSHMHQPAKLQGVRGALTPGLLERVNFLQFCSLMQARIDSQYCRTLP